MLGDCSLESCLKPPPPPSSMLPVLTRLTRNRPFLVREFVFPVVVVVVPVSVE